MIKNHLRVAAAVAASAPRLAQTGASIVPLAVVSAGLMVLAGVSFIARRTFDR